jgi:hypothetical protein
MNRIAVQWDNLTDLTIKLANNTGAKYIWSALKHLQHLPLQLDKYVKEDPFDSLHSSLQLSTKELTKLASNVGINIPLRQDLTQEYINQLHKIYEKNYNGDPLWLEFHEVLHITERHLRSKDLPEGLTATPIGFDWREQAGLLVKPYDRNLNEFLTADITAGTVYLKWQELGKKPYRYWFDNEPNDINRICDLAKPWCNLYPAFYVAIQDTSFNSGVDLAKFDHWFEPFKDQWCEYWGLTDWTSEEMYKVLPIGSIDNLDQLINRLKNKQYPVKIKRL